MLTPSTEVGFIERLTSALPRSPRQLNALQESDAEIITVPGILSGRIAITIDTIAEEIRSGLYADPWLVGWMSVMANMSDLAAVGADPVGILVSESIPPHFPQDALARLQQGIADACRACGTFVLGGDTNEAAELSITGCALGMTADGHLLKRKGCRAGDVLYCSGPLGAGNAYAFAMLTSGKDGGIIYRPHARLREGQLVRAYASACMDTSDGVISTIDQLMRTNGLGFALESGWEKALDGPSRDLIRKACIPEWLLLAGLHGEFELLFTIPPGQQSDFDTAAASMGWFPGNIGHVLESQHLTLSEAEGVTVIDTGSLRNLGQTAALDFQAYLKNLLAFDRSAG
jgi:thiamine-monophosphate kinase